MQVALEVCRRVCAGGLLLGAAPGCGNGVVEPIVADAPGAGGVSELAGTATDDAASDASSSASQGAGVEYCADVREWLDADSAAEDGMLSLLNAARRWGLSCTGPEIGEPLSALTPEPELECAARVHARDMFERGYFSHTNPEGEGPAQRFGKAGAAFVLVGEVIGDSRAGASLFEETIRAGGADCSLLLSASFDAVGVGYYQGLWTIALASSP